MKSYLTLLLCLTLLGAFILLPAAFLHPTSTLPDDNDTLLISYIINQVQINLLDSQKPLFWGSFFFPFPNTLAYSDLFLTSAILTLPLKLFSTNPLLPYNTLLVTSIIATAATSYLLFHYLTRSPLASAIASLVFVFSGFHFAPLPHLQIFNLTLLPLCLYFLLRYLDTSRRLFLHLFFLCGLLQLLDTIFTTYLIIIASLVILAFRRPTLHELKSMLLHFLPYALIALFLLMPYLQLPFSFAEAKRPLTDAAHFAHSLDTFFTGANSIITLLLFVLLFPKKITRPLFPWITLLLISATLSLGPILKFSQHTVRLFNLPLPLPYALFYYLVPGFTGFRTPSRFIMLTLLSLSVLLAFGLSQIKFSPKLKPLLPPLVLALLLTNLKIPQTSYRIDPTPPPVYQQLSKLPSSSVILEWPPLLWNQPGNQLESLRSLYSLDHQLRRFNGYSGFAPLTWINTVHQLQGQGLNQATYSLLRSLNVTHLLLPDRLISL